MGKRALIGFCLAGLLAFMASCGGTTEEESEKHQEISGVVAEVEYIAEGSSFNAPDIKQTIVRFEDGRVKAFNGISNAVFQEGVINVITFSKRDNIISVKTSAQEE